MREIQSTERFCLQDPGVDSHRKEDAAGHLHCPSADVEWSGSD